MEFLGDVAIAKAKINFSALASTMTLELYTLRFSPIFYEGSNWVSVTRSGGTPGAVSCENVNDCPVWTVTSMAPEEVALLISDNANDEGAFEMPFEMTVALLPQ